MVQQGPTLEDIRKQLKQMRASGLEQLSGLTDMTTKDMRDFEKAERILEAMTEDERKNVDLLLDADVRQRIASQSGTQQRDVEELISQAAQVRVMLRKLLPRK